MSDKKHIDRIFQEKLKDFEATPDKAVWDKISNKLNQKKDDRKVIPIWWKFAGIAAALLLLFTVGNLIFNDSNSDDKPTIVETDKADTNNLIKDDNASTIVNFEEDNLNDSTNNLTEDPSSNDNSFNQSDVLNKENIVVNSDKSSKDNNQTESKSDNKKHNPQQLTNPNSYLVSSHKNQVTESIKNATEQPLNINNDVPEDVPLNSIYNKETVVENQTNGLNSGEKNIIEDNITEKQEELIVVEEEKKIPLTEDVIVKNEDINEEEKPINRWQINPNIAPVYYNSLGKGSSIDSLFANNSKTGNVNLSYGINASYNINKKLSVRTGINKVNLSYNTKDVISFQIIASTSNASPLRNIKLANNTNNNVMFLSANNTSLSQAPRELTSTLKASIDQELGFIEVPLELKYNVSSKKLGVNVIGGFSMLFLNDNKVYSVLNEVKTLLGEATNLNNISYSANVGLGLDFNISKSVNLNLDPMFKYQINTFNNTSGDFKPYFIGVYSGINVKF